MISYEDLRIQLAIYNSLMELNFQVKRRPVSQPLAQTALFIGSSLLLPTSLGTNQHPRALQECQTLVTQGQRKVLPEFACDRFPSLLFWNYPKDQFSSVLEEQTFFFSIDIVSTLRFVHPKMSSQEDINMFIRPGQLKCAQKTINYRLTGSQLFNHIPL